MKNKINHSFLRKAAKGILDHLGTEEEGEDPSLPEQDNDVNGAGTHLHDEHGLKNTAGDHIGPLPGAKTDGKKFEEEGAKKKKNTAMALLASNLASKFNKGNTGQQG